MQIVAYGAGTNSTAMLIEMQRRGEKVDAITFADTGGERPETYAYVTLFSEWLVAHGYPVIVTVRNSGMYSSLEDNCLKKKMLPSIAYGFKSCSDKYKRRPQDKFFKHHPEAVAAWKRGEKVVKCIGYDADETRRARIFDDDKYTYRYPLIEWDMGREENIASIQSAGLPLPGKSACFFCPSSRKSEILLLRDEHPDLLQRALFIEQNAQENLTSVKGLGRRFSWGDFIASEGKSDLDDIETPCGCYDG